jgi:DNA-binding CsgD family transcriptional regulator
MADFDADELVLYCVVSHENQDLRLHPCPLGETVIGRSKESQLFLNDEGVSRPHAVLAWDGQQATIRDNSKNGLICDGREIKNWPQAVALFDGSEVQIAGYRLRICFTLASAVTLIRLDQSTQSAVIANLGPGDLEAHREKLLSRLSPRQQEVCCEFLEGKQESEIAAKLRMAPSTVHTHARAIYARLEVTTRPELILLFLVPKGTHKQGSGS